MCGRYTVTRPEAEIAERLQLMLPLGLDVRPRYNVAPGQRILGVAAGPGGRHADLYRWGFTPVWMRGKSKMAPPINAKSETAPTSKMFASALRHRRLLVPADGFYEWQRHQGGGKTPMRFTVDGGALFAFAGIWEPPIEEGAPATCAVLTTAPNALVGEVHDRQPVILRPEHESLWLDPATDPTDLAGAFEAFPAERMAVYPVSSVVNSSRHDGPDCIQPVA